MSLCLSYRNYVVSIASRGMHHKDHYTVPQPQGLQPQLTVGIAPIFAGDRKAGEDNLTAHKIKAVIRNIGFPLDFIVSDHKQTVDALLLSVKQAFDLEAPFKGTP
jgi:hypothetical protein